MRGGAQRQSNRKFRPDRSSICRDRFAAGRRCCCEDPVRFLRPGHSRSSCPVGIPTNRWFRLNVETFGLGLFPIGLLFLIRRALCLFFIRGAWPPFLLLFFQLPQSGPSRREILVRSVAAWWALLA